MTASNAISLDRIAVASLTLAICAMPFSIPLCHAGFVGFLICWIFEGDWKHKLVVFRGNMILQALLLFFLIQCIGLVYSQENDNALFSLEKKIFLVAIPLAVITTQFRLTSEVTRMLIGFFVLTCFVACIICIGTATYEAIQYPDGAWATQFNYLGPGNEPESLNVSYWMPFSYIGLAHGIGLHPTYFSLYLAFCCVVLLNELVSTRSRPGIRKRLIIFLFIFFSIFIVFLSSRVVLVSLLAVYIVALASAILNKRPVLAVVLASMMLAAIITVYINPVSRYRNVNEPLTSSLEIRENTNYYKSSQVRVSLWWLGLNSLATVNPVWGAGTGDVEVTMRAASEKFAITNVLNSFNPHNQYLHILIANGAVGLLALLFLLGIIAYTGWKNKEVILLGFIALIALAGITETVFELQKGIAFFAMMGSLLLRNQKSQVFAQEKQFAR